MKRYHLFIFFFLLFQPFLFADEYSIIEQDNKKGLIDEKGNVLIPPVYEELGWSSGNYLVIDDVIGYKSGNLWGLINTRNTRITPPEFLDIYPLKNQYCIASKQDSYRLNSIFGLISLSSGKTIVPFSFATLKSIGDRLIASQSNNNLLYYGIIDFKGKTILDLIYKEIISLSPRLYAVRDKNDIYRLVNNEGVFINMLDFEDISTLTDDVYLISKEGQFGLISGQGEVLALPSYRKIKLSESYNVMGLKSMTWQLLTFENELITELTCDDLHPLDENLYKTERKEYNFILSKDGTILFKIKNADISILNDSLSAIKPDQRSGVINNKGKIIYPPEYDSIQISGSRLFLFKKQGSDEGWQIGDLHGSILTRDKYQNIHSIDGRYLAIKKHNRWGVSDIHGTAIIDPIFDTLLSVNENKFLVRFHGETGVIGLDGEWRSYPRKGDLYLLDNDQYLISSYYGSQVIDFMGKEIFKSGDYLKPVEGGYMIENYRHQFGLLNRTFKTILPVRYLEIKTLISDSVFLFKDESGYGAVNNEGNILFEKDTRFEEILGISENYIGVRINGEYGFIDCKGRLRIANRYRGIGLFREGLANINILGKWGCVDKMENIIIQPYYDSIEPFQNGLAIAEKEDKFGIINKEGATRISFEYDSINRLKEGGFICYLEGKAGLIDQKGTLKFYPKFDSINDLQNGYIIVQRKGKFGVLNDDGVIKIPVIHDRIKFDHINQIILTSNRKSWELLKIKTEASKVLAR